MSDHKHWRRALEDWNGDIPYRWEHLHLAVQMAILEELKKLNATIQCPNTQRIPRYLARIAANTSKKQRKK